MVISYLNSREISTKISTKQQINDIVQKIAETTGKTPHETYAMARVQGPSMDPLFKHGANVPVDLMPFDAKYKKGDIIAFEHNGEFIIHKVEYRFKSDDGKIYYVTGGINSETNQYVDESLVLQDNIIGKADLSKKGMIKVAKQGQIVYIEAYGMPQQGKVVLNAWLQNAFDKAKKLAKNRDLGLVSDEQAFKEAVEEARAQGKQNSDAILEWQHPECGHTWENSYINVRKNIGTCPKCSGQKINQRLTNAIGEYIFKELGYIKGDYKIEYGMIKIFPELKGAVYHTVHVDGFVELTLKDKNGHLIKLAIEFLGQQHNPDEDIGFEAHKVVSHQLNIKEGTQEYKKLKRQWRDLIIRDEFKVNKFESKNEEGYYLIVVPYYIDINERQEFIIKKFEEQTGITLSNVPYVNWRLLRSNN